MGHRGSHHCTGHIGAWGEIPPPCSMTDLANAKPYLASLPTRGRVGGSQRARQEPPSPLWGGNEGGGPA